MPDDEGLSYDRGVRCAVAVAILVAIILAATLSAAAPPRLTPAMKKAGKAVYEATCAACHGASGKGDGPVAFAVKPPPRNLVSDPFKAGDTVEQIYATVTKGLPNTTMVGYPQIKDADRWAVAYYVRAFRTARTAPRGR